MASYYAVRPEGVGSQPYAAAMAGGPATLFRFNTKQERDEFVATMNYATPISGRHIWVKQALWRMELDGYRAKNWDQWSILTVSYDMTAA